MIALSASTLVNAGPEPLDLFGVSDWREGCPTLRRHDHGNSPVRPMTVDAPLPPAPQIGPFVGQMQHTNDNCLHSAPAAPFWTSSKARCLPLWWTGATLSRPQHPGLPVSFAGRLKYLLSIAWLLIVPLLGRSPAERHVGHAIRASVSRSGTVWLGTASEWRVPPPRSARLTHTQAIPS